MKSPFKNQGYCQSIQVLTQGTPFTTHIHLNAVACERVSELDVYIIHPISLFPVFNVFSFAFCWFQVPMALSAPKQVDVMCQIYR